jgi:serine/threonine protein kinase
MRAGKAPPANLIPGYRLLEPLGSGGFGEVWKCEAPGGLFKAIKFVYGDLHSLVTSNVRAEEELRAIQRIKAIRHPFVLSLDRVEVIDGDLVIVMELADKSLHDLLCEYRQRGLPGVPRGELLGYLREAAEALDLMNQQHGLQHLDVKPQNLFLVSNHVKVADFGLVQSLQARGERDGSSPGLGTVTPTYASPEAFRGILSPHSDQYSLAIVYQELLTGTLPFRGQNVRQMLIQHTQDEPNLAAVPPCDWPALRRALAKAPEHRFESCTEFVRALPTERERVTRLQGTAPETIDDLVLDVPRNTPLPPEERITATWPLSESSWSSASRHPGRPRASRRRAPDNAPPGYQFLTHAGGTAVSEHWAAIAPDGRQRLVKFLQGCGQPDGPSVELAIARLTGLSHPALPTIEVLQAEPPRLILAADPQPPTLRDRCHECQSHGLPGVPRAELLGYLGAVAEVLDHFARTESLQHLGLNPRAILLDRGRVLLADFGLIPLLWVPAGQSAAQLNPRYAAPELFERRTSRGCDVYSLALIYAELLTGTHPYRSPRARTRLSDQPDLERLSVLDREIVARALASDPQQRWPTCGDLVRALEAPSAKALADRGPTPTGAWHAQIAELLATAAGMAFLQGPRALPASTASGEALHHRYTTQLPRTAVRQKLDLFRQQWTGQLLRASDELYSFQVRRSLSFWQRWLGRRARLEVQVQLPVSGPPTEVLMQVRPFGCGREQGQPLLTALAPLLFESAATCLQAAPERRVQARIPWEHPVQVCFVSGTREIGPRIDCRGKDLSLTGIGLFLPPELPSRQVQIFLRTPTRPEEIAVSASITRVQACSDGWYQVGATFIDAP